MVIVIQLQHTPWAQYALLAVALQAATKASDYF